MNEQELTMTEAAKRVLQSRYLRRNDNGELSETPGMLFRRGARAVAQIERQHGGSEAQVQRWGEEFSA